MATSLNKLFVFVSAAATADFKKTYCGDTKSMPTGGEKKIYFLAGTNEIYTRETLFGASTDFVNTVNNIITSTGLKSDGTLPDNAFSADGQTKDATSLYAAIQALNDRVQTVDTKLTASKTLTEGTDSIETAIALKYVASTSTVPAYIAIEDKDNTVLSKVDVSDIIGNGVLNTSYYTKDTGILTLGFSRADGTTAYSEINVGDMLDINDVMIKDASAPYLGVDLTGGENAQAVFEAKIGYLTSATASATGIADAYDVKTYMGTYVAQTIDSLDVTSYTAGSTSYVTVTYAEANGLVTISDVAVTTGVLDDAVGMTYTNGKWAAATGTITTDKLATIADVAAEIAADEAVVASALNDHESRIETLENDKATRDLTTSSTYTDSYAYAYVAQDKDGKISSFVSYITDGTLTYTTGTGVLAASTDGLVSAANVASVVNATVADEAAKRAAAINALNATAAASQDATDATSTAYIASYVSIVETAGALTAATTYVKAKYATVAFSGTDRASYTLSATATGIVDDSAVAEIKKYVDAVAAANQEGITFDGTASSYFTVDTTDDHKVTVNDSTVTATAGTTDAAPTITASAGIVTYNAVVGGIKDYTDYAVSYAVSNLDATVTGNDSSSLVGVSVTETDGLLTSVTVSTTVGAAYTTATAGELTYTDGIMTAAAVAYTISTIAAEDYWEEYTAAAED